MGTGHIIYTQQETLQAQRIGKRPDQVPPALMRMLLTTTRQALAHHTCATTFLHQGITFEEAEQWFTAFAKGVQYVHERYGTIFNQCYVVETILLGGKHFNNYIGYQPKTDSLLVTADKVVADVKLARDTSFRGGNIQTPGYHFTAMEVATMLGVEEAYHAYQMKCQAEKYDGKRLNAPPPDASRQEIAAFYYHDPCESDAKKVVGEAASELGLGIDAASRILKTRIR